MYSRCRQNKYTSPRCLQHKHISHCFQDVYRVSKSRLPDVYYGTRTSHTVSTCLHNKQILSHTVFKMYTVSKSCIVFMMSTYPHHNHTHTHKHMEDNPASIKGAEARSDEFGPALGHRSMEVQGLVRLRYSRTDRTLELFRQCRIVGSSDVPFFDGKKSTRGKGQAKGPGALPAGTQPVSKDFHGQICFNFKFTLNSTGPDGRPY